MKFPTVGFSFPFFQRVTAELVAIRGQQQMDTTETAAAVGAIVTALGALIEMTRRRWNHDATSRVEADSDRKAILAALDKQHVVMRELADVLKHPNDTDFGVRPVLEKLHDVEHALEQIQKALEDM